MQPGLADLLRRVLAGVAVAALALLALWAAFSGAPPRAPRDLAAAASAGFDALAVVPSPPEPDEDSDPVRATPVAVVPTAKEFVQRALQSDDLRLRTQAWRLVRHCAFVLAPGAARPLVSPPAWMAWDTVRKADQAWQAASQRCDPLRSLPDHQTLQRRLDPVPAEAVISVEGEKRWLTHTFQEHGSAALLWAGDALVGYLDQRGAEADGDRFELLDPEAIQLARCHFGEDCGADSDAAHAACLTLGACEGDVQQRLLSSLGSRAARERVQRQARALTDALAQGDLSRYGLGK